MAALALASAVAAQISSYGSVLTVNAPAKVFGKRNRTVTVDLRIGLRDGFHVNSHKPNDPYLIPLKFTWDETVAKPLELLLPEPRLERYPFSPQPVSVFTGDFKARLKFRILPGAPKGMAKLTGKLRYQACNEKMCLPPRTIEVAVPLEIAN